MLLGDSLKLLSREKKKLNQCGDCRLNGALGHISVTQFMTGTTKGLGAGDGEQLNEIKQIGEYIDFHCTKVTTEITVRCEI